MSLSNPKIVELDFGMGNIRSLQKAFEHQGQPVEVIQDPEKISSADAVILPGDGAFGKAIEELKSRGFFDAVVNFYKTGKPILGICIGFQILFSESEEFGNTTGFSFLPGKITRFENKNLLVPHIGWTKTRWNKESKLTNNIPSDSFFYYVHSYRLNGTHENSVGLTEYGGEFTSVIEKDNLFATQFHPEKSQKWGLKILDNFINIVKN
ncbi:MAG: imidazole glycerol phosphate synthase subunit HisH [Spirochaetia bacterium]|nr:imidazole glycerol phosphate synthase subunit HisH [Spirochaetia bacterium]